MTDVKFDAGEFLSWLEEQDGSIPSSTLEEEWPNFPSENIPVGITIGISDDGESLYYKRDLRRAAKRLHNLD